MRPSNEFCVTRALTILGVCISFINNLIALADDKGIPKFIPVEQSSINMENGFVAYRERLKRPEISEVFSFILVKVNPAIWNLAIQIPSSAIPAAGNTDITGLALRQYALETKAKLVMSGGYLASFSPAIALGLVIKSG